MNTSIYTAEARRGHLTEVRKFSLFRERVLN